MIRNVFLSFALLFVSVMSNYSALAQPKASIQFVNDYPDTYHLALIIYTPDGKNQTRVSDLQPRQSKTYTFPLNTSIYIADYKQEAYAMKGTDIRTLVTSPDLVVSASDQKRTILLSKFAKNNQKRSLHDLSGIWQFTLGEQDIVQRVTLGKNGDSVCGSLFGQPFCSAYQEGSIHFRIADFWYSGKLMNGSLMEGTFVDKQGTRAQWKAIKETATIGSMSLNIEPSVFYRSYSSLAAPLLRLSSGDTVSTYTVDASGTDKNSKKHTWGGNPLTGPFYIENSMPGDMIAIHLISVKTNRSWAYSGRSIVENALETSYLLSRNNTIIDNAWIIDTEAQQLKMESPSENLKNYRIPLNPFLGCVGLASSLGTGQSSRESGNFGGNMEEKMIATGSTLYLPVAVQGGYLYFGDGHAAQGDGELTGNAMETSMDIRFSVELIRNQSHAPRVENKDYIKSIGIAATLDQAMKQATTDMTRWLQSEYRLTEPEAAMLMGFSVEFSIPDLVGSNVSVTATISKKVLESLKK